MATTWTAQSIADLEDAIKSGVRQARGPDGRMVTYHSLDEMIKLLNFVTGRVVGRTLDVSLLKFTRG